jgi:hypothetical protein
LKELHKILDPYLNDIISNIVFAIVKGVLILIFTCAKLIVLIYEIIIVLLEFFTLETNSIPGAFSRTMNITQTEFMNLFSWTNFEQGRGSGTLFLCLFFYFLFALKIKNINKLIAIYEEHPLIFSITRRLIMFIFMLPVIYGLFWLYFIGAWLLLDQFLYHLLMTHNYPVIVLIILIIIFIAIL